MTSLSLCMLLLVSGLTFVAPKPQYVVEIHFVVDNDVVRRYENLGYDKQSAIKNIRGDVDYTILQANKIFESMSKHASVQIRATDVEFASTDLFSFKNGLDTDTSLAQFGKYLKAHKHQYDLAVALTGHNMHISRVFARALGAANSKSVCRENAIATAFFDGTQKSAIALAREVAVSLGAPQDVYGKCQPTGYIEETLVSPESKYRWSVTSCSETAIVNNIMMLVEENKNCLVKTTAPAPVTDLASQNGRDILDPEHICQRSQRNASSFFCKSMRLDGSLVKGDSVCQAVYCTSSFFHRECVAAYPSEGMVCDVGKRCNQGKCMPAPSNFPTPSGLVPDCIYGDTRNTLFFHGREGTCSDVLRNKISRCYNHVTRSECCVTCAKLSTGVKGCEYGNKHAGCDNLTRDKCHPAIAEDCCETCG